MKDSSPLMKSSLLYLNGIDAETGTYLLGPFTAHEIAAQALAERSDRDHLSELDRWREELEHR